MKKYCPDERFKKMRKAAATFILTILVIVLPLQENGITLYAENGTVTVAINGGLAPWVIKNNGILEGVYPEIAKKVIESIGMRCEFLDCPVARCETLIENGIADLVIGLKDTAERTDYIRFLSVPYRISSRKVFYIRKDEKKRLSVYNDLYSFKIGIIRGGAFFPAFDSDIKIITEPVSTDEQNFNKLIAGRIDAVAIPEDRGEYQLSVMGISDKVRKAVYGFNDSTPRYIGISKKSPLAKRIKDLDKAMKNISTNGAIEKIYIEHFFKKYGISPDSVRWKQ